MKTARVKYGLTVAGQMVYRGTVVTVLDPLSPQVQNVWPGIENRMSQTAVVVQFPHLSFPILADSSELEIDK